MSTHPHTNLFTEVDRTKDPDFFIRFMDEAQKPPAIQASKRLILERIAPASGAAVLDVGCGPGAGVLDMVGLVGPTGRLVGLDSSEVMFGSHLALLQTRGTLTAARAQRWWEYLQHADERGTLLISFTAFIVVGTKS